MIESVRTPEPRVQGQGICPVCDFASRPATKEQTAFRRQPATSFPTRSGDSSTSFPLADRQSTQDKRTRDALFTRAQQHNQDKRIQQRSATMFAVYLCPTRNTLFLTTVERAVDHTSSSCVQSVKLKAMCNVQVWRVDGQAQTLLLTREAKTTYTCQHNALLFGQFDSSPTLKATLKTN